MNEVDKYSHLSPPGFAGKVEECQWQVAVARGILVEVVLVVVLGAVEVLQRFYLHDDGVSIVALLLLHDLNDDGQIALVGEVDAGAIAGALVLALPVEAGGVDGLHKHTEEELQVGLLVVVSDVYGLGVAGGVGIDLLVGGVPGMSVSKAHFGLQYAPDLLEEMLAAPEAAASEINLFCHIYSLFIRFRMQNYIFFR